MAPSTNLAQPTVHVAHDRAVMVAAVDVPAQSRLRLDRLP